MPENELVAALETLKAKIVKHWGEIPGEIAEEVQGLEAIARNLILEEDPAEPPVEPVVPPAEPPVVTGPVVVPDPETSSNG